MAETSYSKKCTSCGGNKWEYKRELKLWICRYCGNQVERQEQYDGLYTIKNVVRQVILDSAYRRLEQADRNISECQKINSRYVGTLIAGICFRLIAAVSGGLAGQDPRAMLGQLRRDYEQLKEESPDMNDDETAVYEFWIRLMPGQLWQRYLILWGIRPDGITFSLWWIPLRSFQKRPTKAYYAMR